MPTWSDERGDFGPLAARAFLTSREPKGLRCRRGVQRIARLQHGFAANRDWVLFFSIEHNGILIVITTQMDNVFKNRPGRKICPP